MQISILRSITLFLSIAAVLCGCASAKKKQCETENWSEFGRNRALNGLNWRDPIYFGDCDKEGVPPNLAAIQEGHQSGLTVFCRAETFLKAGTAGELVNPELCPDSLKNQLQATYQQGLKTHCTKQGAFSRGKLGKSNLRVCTSKIQKSYDSYFARGRSNYLKTQIAANDKRLAEIDLRFAAIERETAKAKEAIPEYQRQRDERNNGLMSTIGFMTSEDPTEKIRKLDLERQKLETEKISALEKSVGLKSDLTTTEAEITDFEPGELDSE